MRPGSHEYAMVSGVYRANMDKMDTLMETIASRSFPFLHRWERAGYTALPLQRRAV